MTRAVLFWGAVIAGALALPGLAELWFPHFRWAGGAMGGAMALAGVGMEIFSKVRR